MAFAIPLIGIASAVVTGVGEMSQARYQAQVAKNNYNTALANAQKASDAAQIEQKRSDLEYAQLEGQQMSTIAASGLDLLGASQQRIFARNAATRRDEALDIRSQGQAQIDKYRSDAENFRTQGKVSSTSAWVSFAKMGLDIGNQVSMLGGSKSTRGKK